MKFCRLLRLCVIGTTFALNTCLAIAAPDCQPQQQKWRIVPKQFGCYKEISVCVIGPEDVAALPNRGGTLGIKTVGSDYVTWGDFVFKFKVFEIFDLGRKSESPMMARGKKIMHVDTFAFNSEETLRRYVASRLPGDSLYVSFGEPKDNMSDFVCLRVMSKDEPRFDTTMPDYVTYEQGVRIEQDQTIRALLSVANEVAPYILLYKLGTLPAPAFGEFCVSMGYSELC